ncbi:MAG: hypothetical protein IJ849_01370 [Selenomonadaceae bacterium]|nr:hypothetical protein [Selenomonadaceae bacterium]
MDLVKKLAAQIERKEKELAKLKLSLALAMMHVSPNNVPSAGECRVRQATPEELAAIEKPSKGS